MCTSNQPPFYVGQKVLALKDSKIGHVKKGEVYTVAYCVKNCCSWYVGIKEAVGVTDRSICKQCGGIIYHLGHNNYCGRAKFFAPITEQYADITASIAADFKQTNEVPDKVFIPETVSN